MASKTGSYVAGGALLLGGAWALSGNLDALGCAYPDPRECFDFETEQKPAEVVIGDMEIKSEDLVGTTSFLTYGEIAIRVGGDPSVADYESSRLIDISDIDATMYWNRDGDETLELRYNPCILKEQDYGSATSAPVSPSMDSVGSDPVNTVSTGELNWTVDFVESGPDIGTIDKVTVDAGILDTCFMRILETTENQNTFSYNPDNQESVGSSVDATFRWIIRNSAVKYGQAEACPEAVVEMDAIKTDVARVALGNIIAENPEKAQVVSDAYAKDKFIVNLESPEVRKSAYKNDFNAFLDKVKEMDESLPDSDGNTTDMIKPKIGSFEPRECAIPVSEFEIVPTDSEG